MSDLYSGEQQGTIRPFERADWHCKLNSESCAKFFARRCSYRRKERVKDYSSFWPMHTVCIIVAVVYPIGKQQVQHRYLDLCTIGN